MKISEDIINNCIKGQRAAQYQLYELCYGMIKSVCIRYAKDQDETLSLLNMAFYKILTKLDKYPAHIPFEAWAKRVTINNIIDEYRKTKKLRAIIEYRDNVTDYQNTAFDYNEADAIFDAEDLLEVIKQLTEPMSTAFNLFAIDGYTHKEVAEILACSVGTSKWYVNQARKKLQNILEQRTRSQYLKTANSSK